MNKTLLFLALLISTATFSQVVSLKENDRFTKKNILQVNAMKGKKWSQFDNIAEGIGNNVYFSLKAENINYYLQLNTFVNNLTCLSEDSKVILLLEDESTIELFNKAKTDCASQNQSITGRYSITEDQIKLLSEKYLSEFRIYYSEGYSDYTVKNGKKDIVKGTAKLFLNELPN